MTVHGFLNFAAELRGLAGDARKKAVNRAVELCFLENVLHQSIDTLSKGYKHRTCLAQSLIHDPEMLILDEPTDGLDPNQKHEVRNLIKRMGENKAIIFSTHILEEVEAVCSRVIIIDRGQDRRERHAAGAEGALRRDGAALDERASDARSHAAARHGEGERRSASIRAARDARSVAEARAKLAARRDPYRGGRSTKSSAITSRYVRRA